MHRLLADEVAVDADHVDEEQHHILPRDALAVVVEKAPQDIGDRACDEEYEGPPGRLAPQVERNDQSGDRSGDGAVPLEGVDQPVAQAPAPISSRPISMRRISLVPAPMSSSLASRM